ncbi:MAG: hypothetical protein ACE5GA_01355 [Candidatus Zixiibacteriota bacterium]
MTRATGVIGSRGIFGILLVASGGIFLLSSYFRGFYWEDYWPLLFVVWGAARFASYGLRRWGFTAALVLLGLLLYLEGYDRPWYIFHDLRWDVIWPLGLVLIGGYMVARSVNARGRAESAADGSEKDTLSAISILGGNNSKALSQSFRGGSALAFLGGVEIDMRGAKLAPDRDVVTIDTTAVLGSIELYVPADWAVTTKGVPLMGSIEDQRPNPPQPVESGKTLVIDGIAIMGSVEIKL